jgi:hypothetical protein
LERQSGWRGLGPFFHTPATDRLSTARFKGKELYLILYNTLQTRW